MYICVYIVQGSACSGVCELCVCLHAFASAHVHKGSLSGVFLHLSHLHIFKSPHTELGAHQLPRVAIKLWGVLLLSSLTDGIMSVPFTVFNTTGFSSFPVSFNCQLKIAQSYLKESQRIASFTLVYVHACETF